MKRTIANRNTKVSMKQTIKKAASHPSIDTLKNAFSAADKAVKKHLIHKNKAARIKSRLAKLLSALTSK